jgi:hypothetical protein
LARMNSTIAISKSVCLNGNDGIIRKRLLSQVVYGCRLWNDALLNIIIAYSSVNQVNSTNDSIVQTFQLSSLMQLAWIPKSQMETELDRRYWWGLNAIDVRMKKCIGMWFLDIWISPITPPSPNIALNGWICIDRWTLRSMRAIFIRVLLWEIWNPENSGEWSTCFHCLFQKTWLEWHLHFVMINMMWYTWKSLICEPSL